MGNFIKKYNLPKEQKKEMGNLNSNRSIETTEL